MARPLTAAQRAPVVRRGTGRELARAGGVVGTRGRGGPPPSPARRDRARPFDAGTALRRAGLTVRDNGPNELRRAAGDVVSAPRVLLERAGVNVGGWGTILIGVGASIVALALLRVLLGGRGPEGVERMLAWGSGSVRKLIDPDDPLVARREGESSAWADFSSGSVGGAAIGGGEFSTSPATRTGGFLYPLSRLGALIGTPGAGTHGDLDNWQSRNAVDLRVPVGTPVLAPESGRISTSLGFGVMSTSGDRFHGQRLHLVGDSGRTHFFHHLSKITVRRGQRVRAGQVLGYSGTANGVPHLHYAVDRGSPYDVVGRGGRGGSRQPEGNRP